MSNYPSPGANHPTVFRRYPTNRFSSFAQHFALVVSLAATIALNLGCRQDTLLIADGESPYQIFVSANASTPEKNAALHLQNYLHKVSGCLLPVTHEKNDQDRLIFVGFAEAPASLLKDIDSTSFENEEFLIRSDGQQLLIAGGKKRGTLYGVASYLTDHLGFRFYTREVIHIPSLRTVKLDKIDDRQKPAFEYREPYYREAYDTEWAIHNKTNTRAIPDSLGGAYTIYPFVHTFDQLVPPAKYFASHPEYFSEVNGKRTTAQLCLTNQEVVRIATETVFGWIRQYPNANVFSVDQNDFGGNCTCRHCKALDDREGSPSGSLLNFVNQIADSVAAVYPEIKLQTLAYHYTEVPPKNIRPADNVTIRLCHYDYCSAHALGTCTDHEPFIERLDQWKKIAKRVTIWDYYTQFASYLMPFPNFETVKNDVRFYAERGVIGLFAQGNNVPSDGNGEFSELRAWVFAQLMWNPYQDAQTLIDEFVREVYGPAEPHLKGYIQLLHDQVKSPTAYFSIWTDPEDTGYLTPGTIRQADSLFVLAKEASKNDAALLRRVERAHLPVIYSKLYFHSIGGTAYTGDKTEEIVADYERIIADNKITSMAEVPETGSIPAFLDRVKSKDVFYTDWWTIGPFDNTDRRGFHTAYGPEERFDSTLTYAGAENQTVKWTRYSDNASGYVDFARLFKPKDDVVAYAYRIVDSPEARTARFGVGSNDGVKVWVNGKTVLDRFVSRKAIPKEDIVTVQLKKGPNTLLVKVDQTGNKWGLYFTELR